MTVSKPLQAKLYSNDNWKLRRRFMSGALIFIAFWISYLLFDGEDTQLARDSVGTLIFGGMGIIMSYVFGAVADDWDKRRKIEPPAYYGDEYDRAYYRPTPEEITRTTPPENFPGGE